MTNLHAHEAGSRDDCGCDCNGAGGCEEAGKPSSQARRALIVGAGSAAFVSTLVNRRAFAAQCGPISHAGSLNNSQQSQQSQCGGLTSGFWKNHAACVAATIGGDPNSIKLSQKLSNLATVDPISANTTFKAALCNASSDASHWAVAILNALSPGFNPHYGYDIVGLNSSILTAFNQSVSASTILDALKTLENDFGTNQTGSCIGQGTDKLCK
jgi:hypothetical protein